MKKIIYSLLLVCSIFLVGCFESSTTGNSIIRLIDNPTDKEIKVAIDGNELVIPAKSSVNHTFEYYGKHQLTYNGQSLNFIVKPTKSYNDGFINPTQSNYYMYQAYYSTKGQTRKNEMIKNVKTFQVTINGEPWDIELPVKIINDVFIERYYGKYGVAWSYGINDKLPEQISFEKSTSSAPIRYKLFREADFIEYLAKTDEELKTLQFPNQPKKYADLTKHIVPNINIADIKCDEGREFVKQHLADWNNLFTLKGDEFTKLHSQIISSDTYKKSSNIYDKCIKEKDYTCSSAIRKIDSAFRPIEQVNLFITE